MNLDDVSTIRQKTTHYVTDHVVEQHVMSDNGSDIWILSDFSRVSLFTFTIIHDCK